MRSWQLGDQAVSWILIAAMIAPFVIAALTHVDNPSPLLATPLLAGVAFWAIAREHAQRPRLWMTLAVVVTAFWPVLYLMGWLTEMFSGNAALS